MTGQALRPSQFVFTFGVGSILEAPNGPRVVLDFEKWGRVFGAGRTPSVSDFAIPDSTAQALLDNGNIFRIPTNVDLNEPEDEPIFSTSPFPGWALCVRHDYLFELPNDGLTRCPGCHSSGNYSSARREAIRFIRACPDGHMDDVDWHGIVHSNRGSCNRTVFAWRAEGGSLRDVTIRCECGSVASLTDIYNRTRHCTGRFPEKGTAYSSCTKTARVTLRGSSSLRIPEIITIITIPRFASSLHRVLDQFQMRTILATRQNWTKTQLLESLQTMAEQDPALMDPRIIDEIGSTPEPRLLQVIDDIKKFGRNRPTSIQEIRAEEFRALQDASEFGHPPDQVSENYEFQVRKRDVKELSFGRHKLRVAPIEMLRVLVVQKGYRRLGTDYSTNKLVPSFYFDGHYKWFPGMEQFGEGIFINSGSSILTAKSPDWETKYRTEQSIESHPIFVWWHTLSHRIISALSLDSGYASASIRETVYAVRDDKTGMVSGGILLYTTQPGGDGSLGGLISMVPVFENVLDAARRNLDFCSNDPLCSEVSVRTRGNNGAACYACLLLSETSCAHRNMYLDRNLLRGNL